MYNENSHSSFFNAESGLVNLLKSLELLIVEHFNFLKTCCYKFQFIMLRHCENLFDQN